MSKYCSDSCRKSLQSISTEIIDETSSDLLFLSFPHTFISPPVKCRCDDRCSLHVSTDRRRLSDSYRMMGKYIRQLTMRGYQERSVSHFSTLGFRINVEHLWFSCRFTSILLQSCKGIFQKKMLVSFPHLHVISNISLSSCDAIDLDMQIFCCFLFCFCFLAFSPIALRSHHLRLVWFFFFFERCIFLFIKDGLNWSKVTINAFIALQNKCCSFRLSIH